MTISTELGSRRAVDAGAAKLDYFERGEGPPVVFLHGLMANSDLWRAVVPQVAAGGYRCLAVDLPLGAHRVPMPAGADLSPPAVADLIAEFLTALDLVDVTLVANDTAGALTQILLTRHPERIGRVVLTNCDALDRFFPPTFNYLTKLIRLPGAAWLLGRILRVPPLRRLPLTYGWLSKRPIPREVMDSYCLPSGDSSDIRRDLRAFVGSVHRRHSLAAARRLPGFTKPVLLAWSPEDRLFPLSLGQALADLFPMATLVEVPDSYTFVPEDQPERLAELITDFIGSEVPGTQ
ncbi:putative oxidoreductase [Alloactinosynnema sp. L-07]|uniref:alpha/beta fold hydrolase n=1 Tax=Alloactinosynnema sp. L-07 TaxID=1653480 RepID=UPI00065EFACF|nr:alpha/beta hydrolase [Alloactinosynnema sp. L-07]CRK61002.1 putative oxidoreductase [Alloactinosynnema sp. L-07]